MPARPNVLIIHTDQQRFDTLGCNNNPLAVTPSIDRLASEGVNFHNHFVQNPVCMPSRMALMTGRYPSSLGIGTNGIPLPPETLTLAGMLGRYGYETALVGKLHFQPHSARDHREIHPDYGFDTLILSDEPGCYRDAYRKWVETIAPDAVDAVNCGLPPARAQWEKMMRWKGTLPEAVSRDGYDGQPFAADEGLTHAAFVAAETSRCISKRSGKPFFIFAGFYAPHPPLNPPASCIKQIDTEAMPLPVLGADESYAGHLAELAPADWKHMKAHYHAMVTDVDRNVGRILKTLKDEGLEEDTLVIFTSDHGEYLGDHGKVGKGSPGYHCIMRTPLIMRCPGAGFARAGKVIDGLVESVDVLPTILDLCGVQCDPLVQGRSLLPLLREQSDDERDSVFLEGRNPGISATKTVRTAECMYSITREAGTSREYLFDLKNDPNELRNVVDEADYAGKLSEMRKLLLERTIEAEGDRRYQTAQY